MMYQIFVVLAVLGMASANYCNMGSCSGRPHIGCGHSGYWSYNCPADATLVGLSNSDKNLILNSHNKLRNKIASGLEPRFYSASRMATMTWDQELADLCTLNVLQCAMRHDQCRNTAQFNFAGQNLAWSARTGSFEPTEGVLTKMIESQWYGEVKDASPSDINRCCSSSSGRVIGHFTQVVTGSAFKVGCSLARYTDGQWKSSLLCCNYARTNLIGTPVYPVGTKASGCKTGTNPSYPGLCSVNEVFNPNQ